MHLFPKTTSSLPKKNRLLYEWSMMKTRGWTKNQLIEQAAEMIRKGNNALEFALSLPGELTKTTTTHKSTNGNGKLELIQGGSDENKVHWTQTEAGKKKISRAMKRWHKNKKRTAA